MSLSNQAVTGAVELCSMGVSCLENSRTLPQAHRAPHVCLRAFWHEDDHRVRALWVKLCAVGTLPFEHMPCILDNGDLHSGENDMKAYILSPKTQQRCCMSVQQMLHMGRNFTT